MARARVQVRPAPRAHLCLHEMDADGVARAISYRGSTMNTQPLFQKLDSGEPIVLGVFGASVAQNAGCLDQGSRRCMRYNGVWKAALPWGLPHVRPFKGWAVRLLDHINASYPSALHRINNSGLDATPAAVANDCLFSYLPSTIDIAILEFGSMAQMNSLSLWAIEAVVRQFLALPSPPMLVLLSVHNWCSGVQDTVRRAGSPRYSGVWDAVEQETLRVCTKYGMACVSQQRALLPLVRDGALNVSDFVRDDPIFRDCLHVINAPKGVDLISTMLTGWFDGARHRVHAHATPRAGGTRRGLPEPLWARNANATISRCYAFTTAEAKWIRPLGLRTRPVRWRSWWCSDRIASDAACDDHGLLEPVNSSLLHCPSRIERDESVFTRFIAQPPRHFFYCHVALTPGTRKQSFGVVALVPGAVLGFGEHVAGGHSDLTVKLSYLQSYSNMGIASVHCQRCWCEPFEIDAHQPQVHESVFVMRKFDVTDVLRDGSCEVVLRVLGRTSSGGNKFKARFVTFDARGLV